MGIELVTYTGVLTVAEGEGQEEALRQFYFAQMAPMGAEEVAVEVAVVAAAAAEASFLEKMLKYDELLQEENKVWT